VHSVTPEVEHFDTLPFGLLPARLRSQLRIAAVRDIVLPCGAAAREERRCFLLRSEWVES
jgi:hypothetical protein